MIVQHHESEYLARRAIDQFDRLYAEGKNRAKIMALAIHPYVSGQLHGIRCLEAIYEHARRFQGVLRRGNSRVVSRRCPKELKTGLRPSARPAKTDRLSSRACLRGNNRFKSVV
jgi:hypothetical protein